MIGTALRASGGRNRTPAIVFDAVLLAILSGMAAQSAQVTATDTAGVLVSASQDDTRPDFEALVVNRGTVSVFIGGDDVTTANGFEVAAGASAAWKGTPNDTVYVITAAATTARVDVFLVGVQ